jgi:predicted dehydrogenase
MKKNNEIIVLIGCGYMAIEYAKVLQDCQIPFVVVGRGQKSADAFTSQTHIAVIAGGIKKYLQENKTIPEKAIVAIDGDQLVPVAMQLLEHNVTSILLEKPGGIDFKEIEKFAQIAKRERAQIFIAYNRRFYASVQKAREIIKQDGGVLSYSFEFTEWKSVIEKLQTAKRVKENWFLQNSTHVIDLAFFLGGYPKEISSYIADSLVWHPKAAVFVGAGVAESGALFSYHANWKGPGRWGIEIITKNHRLILRPLEKLQIQKHGSISIEYVDINDGKDIQYKPGLYEQVKAFLADGEKTLCSLEEQAKACVQYRKILHTKNS